MRGPFGTGSQSAVGFMEGSWWMMPTTTAGLGALACATKLVDVAVLSVELSNIYCNTGTDCDWLVDGLTGLSLSG